MDVGSRIRTVRKAKGFTQKKLGELAGIAEPTIRKYELGKLNPKYETVKKIATALETDPLYLMDGITYKEAFEKLQGSAESVLKDMQDAKQSSQTMKRALLEYYESLNLHGKGRALQQLQELTKIPDYQKKKAPSE